MTLVVISPSFIIKCGPMNTNTVDITGKFSFIFTVRTWCAGGLSVMQV